MHHFVAIGEFKLELQSGYAKFGWNLMIFLAVWPYNLTDDLEKQKGTFFYLISSFVYHFIPIGEFKLELQPGNAKFVSKSMIFLAVWPSNLTDDLGKQ